ncbi:MAG: HPr family phosphocarrier protein [Elusimicrobia bacterium]|jgi:phosphocarrier protein|nr:HPr family phosphocarrier protein [Elusimicrobiota bacterium]MBR4633203.1 HPr family phosphocarrier protein [Elusimicrobiota bacterium]
MKEKNVKIVNKLGLHARPASLIVQTAMAFSSNIYVIKDEIKADAKSIMGILMLAAACGTELKIQADGVDEDKALEKMVEVFDNGFGEEI